MRRATRRQPRDRRGRENARPMAWAKRLGGPGTDFCQRVRRGAATCTANQPRGEIFGPGRDACGEAVGEWDQEPGAAR